MVDMTDSPKLPVPSRRNRFSLANLFLLMTTVVCAAGWIAAQRKAQIAAARSMVLKREKELYQAQLARLEVVDHSKVHAVGLPRSGWRMYFPSGTYQVHSYVGPSTGDDLRGPYPKSPIMSPLQFAGETEVEAEISYLSNDGTWSLEFSMPGHNFRKLLPWELASQSCDFRGFSIAPGQRAVWEPGEPVVLVARQQIDVMTKKPAEVVAVWIEQLSLDEVDSKSFPTNDEEPIVGQKATE